VSQPRLSLPGKAFVVSASACRGFSAA